VTSGWNFHRLMLLQSFLVENIQLADASFLVKLIQHAGCGQAEKALHGNFQLPTETAEHIVKPLC
jgi:hypothetical protein